MNCIVSHLSRATGLVIASVVLAACGADGVTPADAGSSSPPVLDGGSPGSDGGSDGGISGGDGGAPAPVDGPDCEQPGCVRAATWVATATVDDLRLVVPASVTIDNGYRVVRLEFRTGGREALATLAVPEGAPPSGGFHVVVNNPGTSGLDDPCAVSATTYAAGLAGAFGARGLIGVAVDYPGMGTAGIQPYLVSEVEAKAALDGARATLRWLRLEEIPASGRVALVGLSQGGHAVLAAAAWKEGHAPELDVRAFAAAAPASVIPEHWAASVDLAGPHLAYHALLVYSWAHAYGSTDQVLWAQGLRPAIDELMRSRCLEAPEGERLIDALGMEPSGIFAPGLLGDLSHGDISAYPFLVRGFAENGTFAFDQTAPLRIYQGDADDVVLPAFTDDLVSRLSRLGIGVDYVVVPDGGHVDVAFGPLAVEQRETEGALAWIRRQLAAAPP